MSEYGVVAEAGSVRFERTLPGPIELVWAYLTEPDKRALWLAGGPMDLRQGGRVELRFRNATLSRQDDDPVPERYKDHANSGEVRGEVLRCEPPRLLSYTWDDGSGGDSYVTFELTEQGHDVQLLLTHRRLQRRAGMVSVASGWHTHLGLLADRLAGRDVRPFWKSFTTVEAAYERRLPA